MDILFKKNNLVPSAIRDGEAELVFEVVDLFLILRTVTPRTNQFTTGEFLL